LLTILTLAKVDKIFDRISLIFCHYCQLSFLGELPRVSLKNFAHKRKYEIKLILGLIENREREATGKVREFYKNPPKSAQRLIEFFPITFSEQLPIVFFAIHLLFFVCVHVI